MTEAWKEAKTKIKGISSIPISFITPTKNILSPITPYVDVTDTDIAQESPKDHKDPESESEESDSEEDDDCYPTMKTAEYKTVKDLVEDTNVLTAKLHPSLMDVIDFKREVINALTICDLRGDPHDHSYILENNAEFNYETDQ